MFLFSGTITGIAGKLSIDSELEEIKLSKEVEDYMVCKTDHLSEEGAAELNRYEQICAAFTKRI